MKHLLGHSIAFAIALIGMVLFVLAMILPIYYTNKAERFAKDAEGKLQTTNTRHSSEINMWETKSKIYPKNADTVAKVSEGKANEHWDAVCDRSVLSGRVQQALAIIGLVLTILAMLAAVFGCARSSKPIGFIAAALCFLAGLVALALLAMQAYSWTKDVCDKVSDDRDLKDRGFKLGSGFNVVVGAAVILLLGACAAFALIAAAKATRTAKAHPSQSRGSRTGSSRATNSSYGSGSKASSSRYTESVDDGTRYRGSRSREFDSASPREY